jgi:hypothetical protein
MAKIPLVFVGKLTNSPLLVAFPAAVIEILSHFSFATALCKGLYKSSHSLLIDESMGSINTTKIKNRNNNGVFKHTHSGYRAG